MIAKINAKVGKKSNIFWQKFKISNCMPSSPCEPNEQKFGMWDFYHQPDNLRGWWVKLKKKFFEQPYSPYYFKDDTHRRSEGERAGPPIKIPSMIKILKQILLFQFLLTFLCYSSARVQQ